MSKEDWFRAYERNLADGMSDSEAQKHAAERAADVQAQRADEAKERWRELEARLALDPLEPFRSLDAFTKTFGPRKP